ncbi:phospholipid scramblase 3 isoform X1 [Choloepus didactylus]|uniref:phospholipid scramblase 3 isoform X1 n=1 Tax=Choloepus didactylus TaxID=27675 RepID=UPI00189DCAE9|nr:phospholipid scramblase 3 isoform X1 [Choloepus didactylus]
MAPGRRKGSQGNAEPKKEWDACSAASARAGGPSGGGARGPARPGGPRCPPGGAERSGPAAVAAIAGRGPPGGPLPRRPSSLGLRSRSGRGGDDSHAEALGVPGPRPRERRAGILSAQARRPGREGRDLDGPRAESNPGPAPKSSWEPHSVRCTPASLGASVRGAPPTSPRAGAGRSCFSAFASPSLCLSVCLSDCPRAPELSCRDGNPRTPAPFPWQATCPLKVTSLRPHLPTRWPPGTWSRRCIPDPGRRRCPPRCPPPRPASPSTPRPAPGPRGLLPPSCHCRGYLLASISWCRLTRS